MLILRNAGPRVELGGIACILPLVAGLAMERNETASRLHTRVCCLLMFKATCRYICKCPAFLCTHICARLPVK